MLHNLSAAQPEYFPTSDSQLVVPVFQKGDDPIDAINHMMGATTLLLETNKKIHTGASRCNTGKQGLYLLQLQRGEVILQNNALRPKRKWLTHGLNDKVLWFQAQAFITHTAAYQAMIGCIGLDCDELHLAKIALLANLSRNGSDAL
ncbi:hypothetical protein Tco_0801162 [Tanacetum coccineum]|uniref:Uncharacterized protein n=1 Tax=Tanacetum coccineum TaxID=301880 RepID=A0ABQ4ZV77_9ASTR